MGMYTAVHAQYWHYQSDEDADEHIRDAVIDQSGDLIITGLHTFGGAGNNSFYVKVNEAGEPVFYNHFTTNNDMGPNDLSLHPDGSLVLLNKGREWTYYETWTKYIVLGINGDGAEEWRSELDVRPEKILSEHAYHISLNDSTQYIVHTHKIRNGVPALPGFIHWRFLELSRDGKITHRDSFHYGRWWYRHI